MFQAKANPQVLLVAGLAAVGTIYVLVDLLQQLDRLRMAGVTIDEIERLPSTDSPHIEGGPTRDD